MVVSKGETGFCKYLHQVIHLKRTGAYRKSWAVKNTKETASALEVTVYSRDRYRLTHPCFRLPVKNTMGVQHIFQLLFQRQVLIVCIQFHPHLIDFKVHPPVRRKMVAAGEQVTDKGRLR